MKKILALALALTMVLALFAGCNTADPDAPISTELTIGTGGETIS